jgi:hypothetical protein
MRGLDPPIHPSSHESYEARWIARSGPAMMGFSQGLMCCKDLNR